MPLGLVSLATVEQDGQSAAWRKRPSGQIPCICFDARYEELRQDDRLRSATVLMTMGVNLGAKRKVLGDSVSLGKHEVHRYTFCTVWWRLDWPA